MTSKPLRKFYSSSRKGREPLYTATMEQTIPRGSEKFSNMSAEQMTLLINPEQFKQVYSNLADSQNEKFKALGLVTENKSVVSGPLNVLFDWSVTPENSDYDFSKTFIINYHTYCTPMQLLELVDKRCSDILSNGAEPESTRRQKWAKITIFVKNWTELLPSDFADEQFANSFKTFTEKYISQFAGIKQIEKMIDTVRSSPHTNIFERIPGAEKREKMKPLSEVSAEVITQQISLYEFELFKDIELKDFLGGAWTKKDKYERCPRLCEFLDHFNSTTNWVVSSILNEPDINARASLISKFISVAEMMYKNMNFTGFFEFYSGINSACINRLTKTTELIPDFKQRMEPLSKAADPTKSYATYRNYISQNRTKGYIPFIGVVIQDLTFIDEGNLDNNERGNVNFEKCRMVAKQLLSIRELQQNQHSVYNALPCFFDFITSIESHKDDLEKALFDLSLQIQPRATANQ